MSLSENAGALGLFAIESLGNFLQKVEDNPALDGIAQTPIRFISQSDSIISIWRLFTSLESLDNLKTDDFMTLAIAAVDLGGMILFLTRR